MINKSVLLKNTAFTGFVFDKVYENLEAAQTDIDNIIIGHYILVTRDLEGTVINAVYQKVLTPNGAQYNYITTVNPMLQSDAYYTTEQTEQRIAESKLYWQIYRS